jgi:putative transposase
MLWMMERAGMKNSNVKRMQLWQQHNKPIELWGPKAIDHKADYMPNNPVEAGFVLEPYRWKHSRAIDFSSGKGILDTDFLKNYSGIMN